jgi:excisionase family DNA binding protein
VSQPRLQVVHSPYPKIPAEPVRLLFSQKEAAHILGVSVRTVQNLIAARMLPVRRVGRRVLIHRKDLELFARGDHPTIGGE